MLIRDIDAIGFSYAGDNLCRYCTRDLLEQIVIENAYRLPGETDGLGISDLLMICSEPEGVPEMVVTDSVATYYDTEAYDSNDYPKPFEDAEPEDGEDDEFCMNPECRNGITATYDEIMSNR